MLSNRDAKTFEMVCGKCGEILITAHGDFDTWDATWPIFCCDCYRCLIDALEGFAARAKADLEWNEKEGLNGKRLDLE
jgi:hypothetical protein